MIINFNLNIGLLPIAENVAYAVTNKIFSIFPVLAHPSFLRLFLGIKETKDNLQTATRSMYPTSVVWAIALSHDEERLLNREKLASPDFSRKKGQNHIKYMTRVFLYPPIRNRN